MPQRPVKDLVGFRQPLIAEPSTTVAEAAERMSRLKCGSILVCESNRLCGIFTERDLLTRVVAAGRNPQETTLREVMTSDPDTVDANAPLKDAIRLMDEFNYRHLPVVERGRIIGVISLRDVPYHEIANMERELDHRHALAEGMW